MTYNILIIVSFFLRVFQCRIESGTLADYPYMALIGTFSRYSSNFTSACTGSVLTRRIILTTAHCFRQDDNWVAIIGVVAQTKEVVVLEKWILHPHYITTVDATYNDVALTVTEKFIDFEYYMVKPMSIPPLPPNILPYDLICEMIGWEIVEPENLSVDVTSTEFITQAHRMSTIYKVRKRFLSPQQCQSLINLIPDVLMMPDSSFLCVRHHDDEESNETQYGFVGSPLRCKEEEKDPEWMFMGLKLQHRNIDNGMPELYVNIHRYEEYLMNTMNNPDQSPLKYFCKVQVCDKKHYYAGEYCLVGDVKDCYYRDIVHKHYFPVKSFNNECQKLSSKVLCGLMFYFLTVFQ